MNREKELFNAAVEKVRVATIQARCAVVFSLVVPTFMVWTATPDHPTSGQLLGSVVAWLFIFWLIYAGCQYGLWKDSPSGGVDPDYSRIGDKGVYLRGLVAKMVEDCPAHRFDDLVAYVEGLRARTGSQKIIKDCFMGYLPRARVDKEIEIYMLELGALWPTLSSFEQKLRMDRVFLAKRAKAPEDARRILREGNSN